MDYFGWSLPPGVGDRDIDRPRGDRQHIEPDPEHPIVREQVEMSRPHRHGTAITGISKGGSLSHDMAERFGVLCQVGSPNKVVGAGNRKGEVG